MENKDLRKVLENGKEYECSRTKDGCVFLKYYENGVINIYAFDDTMHDGVLSKASYFETPDKIILEIISINFIYFETGSISFTARIHFYD
jgi:hypothetical protein